MSAVRERPILFSGPMVRSILEGRKVQTRRLVVDLVGMGRVSEFGRSDTPGYAWHARDRRGCWNDMKAAMLLERCPYGLPSDRLWVRETWQHEGDPYPYGVGNLVFYRADYLDDPHGPDGEKSAEGRYRFWRPSIHMPRDACRLVLEITDVRVERLQDISEADACAEGTGSPITRDCKVPKFAALWDELNGGGAWEANPWVWVIGFRRMEVANG